MKEYKLGIQELDQMTQRGIVSGEFVVIASLKEKDRRSFGLFLLSRLIVSIKKAYDETKEPIVLCFASYDNLQTCMSMVSDYIIAGYKGLSEMCHYLVIPVNANGFTTDHIKATIEDIEANQVFDVKAVMLDEMDKLSEVKDISAIANEVREYLIARGITCVGTVELNDDAMEVDLGFFVQGFEKIGVYNLSIARGKHRIPTIVQDDKKFCTIQLPR